MESGQPLPDVVHRVNYGTAGGSLAWDGTGEGFYYTRYPRPGERPEADLDFYVQVYHHRLGTPETSDRYEIGKDFPRIAEIELRRSPDGKYVLANVQNGDSGRFEQHVKDGTAYPPVLLTTGANDPRVDPMQSRKMAARLQAATAGRTLVLLRSSATSGHGIGTALDERIALEADVWAFLLSQLGVKVPTSLPRT